MNLDYSHRQFGRGFLAMIVAIMFFLTPHDWLYNVSGLDAVEIVRISGKKFRVGTDEPRALVAALKAAMSDRRSDRR